MNGGPAGTQFGSVQRDCPAGGGSASGRKERKKGRGRRGNARSSVGCFGAMPLVLLEWSRSFTAGREAFGATPKLTAVAAAVVYTVRSIDRDTASGEL